MCTRIDSHMAECVSPSEVRIPGPGRHPVQPAGNPPRHHAKECVWNLDSSA